MYVEEYQASIFSPAKAIHTHIIYHLFFMRQPCTIIALKSLKSFQFFSSYRRINNILQICFNVFVATLAHF